MTFRVALLCLSLAPAALLAQQQPVFRSGVDVVTVDVVVLDKQGRQVTDLTIADFAVVAGGKARRLLSAEYTTAVRPAAERVRRPVDAPPPPPGPSSNTTPQAGRSFLFAVDLDGIRAGEGGHAMKTIGEYLDRLDPSDRVGLVAMPYGTPRVDLTTNHARVRAAAGSLVGASRAVRERPMTYGEAESIAQQDTRALLAYWERAIGMGPGAGAMDGRGCPFPPRRPFEEPSEVPIGCIRDAERALDRHRRHTRDIVDVLRSLAERMADIEGQKTIVFVSEGLLNDLDTMGDVRRFAETAEHARVALYALHLDAPLAEATLFGNSTQSRILDDRAGFDAMAQIADAARGTALRVIGPATNAMARIDEELGGYYLLSFDREPTDRDGARKRIDVRVNRPDLDVRARLEFTPRPLVAAPAPPSFPADLRAAMGTLLKWPAATTGIGLDVDTFVVPVAGQPADARVLLTAEISGGDALPAALGYEIVDAATGKGVADAFDAPAEAPEIAPGLRQYLIATPLPAGSYRLKLGVIAPDGRRGSVEHAFDVPAWPAGALRIGDLVLGAESNGAFRPVARVSPDTPEIVARVEVHADDAAALDGLSARLIIEAAGSGGSADGRGAVGGGPAPEAPAAFIAEVGADPLRRVAVARWPPRGHAPGAFVVTIVLEASGREVARRSRAATRF